AGAPVCPLLRGRSQDRRRGAEAPPGRYAEACVPRGEDESPALRARVTARYAGLRKFLEVSRDSQRLRRSLLRAVATELALGKVVFFHVDADVTWAERVRGCENLNEHWPRFCGDVLARGSVSKHEAVPRDLAALEQVLILAMPFFELESWAFANTRRLR